MKKLLPNPVLVCCLSVLTGSMCAYQWTPETASYPGARFEAAMREAYKWSGRFDWQRSRAFAAEAAHAMTESQSAHHYLNQAARHPLLAQAKAQLFAAIGWGEWHSTRKEDSSIYFQRATELYNDASAHLGMAQVHQARSNPELALLHLAAARRSKIDNYLVQEFTHSRALLEASQIKFELDQVFDACIFALRARLASPGNVETYIQLGKCLAKLGLPNAALEVLNMPRAVRSPNAMILRAEISAKAGKYFDALEALNAIFPEKQRYSYTVFDLPILRARGTIEVARKHYKSAQHWFEQAMTLAPQDLDLRLNAAWAMNKQRKFAAAMQHFKFVLDLDPVHSSALLGLGEAYFELGRFLEAEEVLIWLLQHPPRSVEAQKHFVGWAQFWRGRIFEIRGDILAALTAFETALKFNPVNIPARVHIANLIHKHQTCQAAIPHWIEIRQIQTGRGFHDEWIQKCQISP